MDNRMQKYDFKLLAEILLAHKYKINLSHVLLMGMPHLLKEAGNHTLVRQLERGGLVLNGEVTELGNKVLDELRDVQYSETGDKTPAKKVGVKYSKEFLEFWEAYPRSDNFEYRGSFFTGTRNLRVKKEECSRVYEELLKSYSHTEMVNALNKEVQVRKSKSFEKQKNEMTYMRSTLPYLNSRAFEIFLGKDLASSENNLNFVKNQF